jgi:hypothetical protein
VRGRRLLGRSTSVPIAWLVHLQPLSVRPSTHPSLLGLPMPSSRLRGPNQSFFWGVSQSVLVLLPGFDATPSVHSSGPLASLSTLSRRPKDNWTLDTPSAACCFGGCFQAFSLQLPLITGRLLTRPFVNTSVWSAISTVRWQTRCIAKESEGGEGPLRLWRLPDGRVKRPFLPFHRRAAAAAGKHRLVSDGRSTQSRVRSLARVDCWREACSRSFPGVVQCSSLFGLAMSLKTEGES